MHTIIVGSRQLLSQSIRGNISERSAVYCAGQPRCDIFSQFIPDLIMNYCIFQTNSMQGMITSVTGSVVCAVCYILVIRQLAGSKRDR